VVFTAVTMKKVVFWEIKIQFIPHRSHITSPLQSPASLCCVRFEVFTAVTMKNVVFWDIKIQFIPHRSHITSPLQSPAGLCYVRFEVFTAVTMTSLIPHSLFPSQPLQSCLRGGPGSTHPLHCYLKGLLRFFFR
jgi:hypothetical protein